MSCLLASAFSSHVGKSASVSRAQVWFVTQDSRTCYVGHLHPVASSKDRAVTNFLVLCHPKQLLCPSEHTSSSPQHFIISSVIPPYKLASVHSTPLFYLQVVFGYPLIALIHHGCQRQSSYQYSVEGERVSFNSLQLDLTNLRQRQSETSALRHLFSFRQWQSPLKQAD